MGGPSFYLRTFVLAWPLADQSGSGQLVALVEQFVDLTTRRLAATLADRPTHRGQESQFGVDGVEVAIGRQRERPTGAPQFTPHFRVEAYLLWLASHTPARCLAASWEGNGDASAVSLPSTSTASHQPSSSAPIRYPGG
jgi:hypothetical protein